MARNLFPLVLVMALAYHSTALASASCQRRSAWPGGAVFDCVATLADVHGLPGAPSGWSVSFDLVGARVTQAWNVSITDGDSTRKRLTGMNYNATLSQPASFGFIIDSGDGFPGSLVLELRIPPPGPTVTPAPSADPTPAVQAPLPRMGYFATRGSRIIDASGAEIHLKGLNWFGLETSSYAPHGLWARSMRDLVAVAKGMGFNFIRVPFSDDIFDATKVPSGIDFTKNPDLRGLGGVQILDKVIAAAQAAGLRVMLDRHRPSAAGQSELWFTSQVSEAKWIRDWTALAARYRNDPTVFAVDLHNEPHGAATWGEGSASDWRLAAERAGNAILKVNPDLLIVVEGIEHAGNDWYWWGGNLSEAGSAPVRLSVPGRVVYSAHDYPASVYEQSWFSAPNFPANLPGVWRPHWGYLVEQGIAPVILGEFGTKLATTRDVLWLQSLVAYLKDRHIGFAFWALNPNSGDTGGLLENDWATIDLKKLQALKPLLAP